MPPGLGVATAGSVVASLAVILGLLLVAAIAARKLRDGAWGRRLANQTQIRIIASRSLGWQSSLMIVEAEGCRFLVGTSRAGLTAIGRLDGRAADPADFATMIASAEHNTTSRRADP
jgi:flagellar biogenesis protein FliO